MKYKKVMISGSFAIPTLSQINFLERAANYGDLFVCLQANNYQNGSNDSFFSKEEYLSMYKSLKCVKNAEYYIGNGLLDFEPNMKRIMPESYVINKKRESYHIENLCKKLGVKYIVLEDSNNHILQTQNKLEYQSTNDSLPYRLCLAGGWIDQPIINKYSSGSAVVLSIKNSCLNERSGLATSSRKTAFMLWGGSLPKGIPNYVLAKILYHVENYEDRGYISGAQDQIGLLVPGLSKLNFEKNSYWPKIENINDRETADWLENVLELIPLSPRPLGYNPLSKIKLCVSNIKKLGETGCMCFEAIMNRDVIKLGNCLMQTWNLWKKILPETVNDEIIKKGCEVNSKGFGFSGSNGGYIIRVKNIYEPFLKGSIKIQVRL